MIDGSGCINGMITNVKIVVIKGVIEEMLRFTHIT